MIKVLSEQARERADKQISVLKHRRSSFKTSERLKNDPAWTEGLKVILEAKVKDFGERAENFLMEDNFENRNYAEAKKCAALKNFAQSVIDSVEQSDGAVSSINEDIRRVEAWLNEQEQEA